MAYKKSYLEATTAIGDMLFINDQNLLVERFNKLPYNIQEKITEKFGGDKNPIISIGLVLLGEQWANQQRDGVALTEVTGRV
jgi:hypothetical protein